MNEQMPRPRPEIGATTKKTIKIPICRLCGYIIGEFNYCEYGCFLDSEPHGINDRVNAVYERTDVFMGDEPVE